MTDVLSVMLWTLIAGLSGSLPLAYWIGLWALGVDIRRYGDGNPGAMNVKRAGGWRWFIPALLLEFLKGAIPLWLARLGGGLSEWALLPPAMAAPLGHARSPWLGGKGGKAIAVTFGVWSGLTEWRVPMLMGSIFALTLRLTPPESRAVRIGMLILSGLLLIAGGMGWVHPSMAAISIGHTILLFWTHRRS